jgi:hypothetical protein
VSWDIYVQDIPPRHRASVIDKKPSQHNESLPYRYGNICLAAPSPIRTYTGKLPVAMIAGTLTPETIPGASPARHAGPYLC